MANFYRIICGIGGTTPARMLCVLAACVAAARGVAAQLPAPPTDQATVRLEGDQQRKEGDDFFADGRVQIEYRNLRLRADHVQYNSKTYLVTARGNVQLDADTQHLTADSAEFNVRSGEGRFEHVRGEVRMDHRENSYILVSPNPLVFEAQEVRRLDNRTYTIEHAWLPCANRTSQVGNFSPPTPRCTWIARLRWSMPTSACFASR
jgi:lipopolysaccharide assembly outer membrane protein LptD (OstA)